MINLTSVTINGVKGQTGSHSLGKATLVSGENRSGKTAIIAAIQACCQGVVDKVGGANNKLALLAGPMNSASAELSLSDGYTLKWRVLQGKTASVKREIVHNGMPLDVESAESLLFGKVPQSPKGLLSLSGEELWTLMLPQGEGKAPDTIAAAYNAMRIDRQAVGLRSDTLRELLDSKDIGVAANEGLKLAKEYLSEVQKQIKGLELQLETEIPTYSGPPLHEVNASISELDGRLKAHTTAKKSLKETTEEIARSEALLARQDVAAALEKVKYCKASIEHQESLIASIEEVLVMPTVQCNWRNIRDKGDAFMDASEQLLMACQEAKVFKNAETTSKALKKVGETIDAWCVAKQEQEKDCPRNNAWKALRETKKEIVGDTPENASLRHNVQLKTLLNALPEAERLAEATVTTIDNLTQKIDTLKGKAFDVLSDEEVASLISQLEVQRKYASDAQQVTLLETRRAQVGEQIGKYKQAESSTEKLIAEVNAWRREVIDVSIATICSIANQQLEAIGFDKLKIELSQGKRSAAIISTEGGVHLSVLSGAEETIYGTALLYAIQAFRGVRCPIIFVEGGELSEHYLTKFLASYVNKNVNLVVAHYLSPEVEGVVNISVEEALV